MVGRLKRFKMPYRFSRGRSRSPAPQGKSPRSANPRKHEKKRSGLWNYVGRQEEVLKRGERQSSLLRHNLTQAKIN